MPGSALSSEEILRAASAPAPRPQDDGQHDAQHDLFAALDDPAEWPAFGRESDAQPGQWESRIAIGGMHCAACALTLESALGAVPGVLAAQVSAASGHGLVIWSSERVKPSTWIDAVRRAGYSALPAAGAPQAIELRRKQQRTMLWRWLVAAFCSMQVMMYAWPLYTAAPGDITANEVQLLRWASWVLTLPVLLFSCTPFFAQALKDIAHRRIGMDLPVALGMAITFAVSSAATFDPAGALGGEVYFDSLCMFAFFLLTARWLQARLADRTAGSLEALMNRLPDTVLRRLPDETAQSADDEREAGYERVAVRRLRVGDLIRVLPGEAFAADGRVLEGSTSVDEALLTGESEPLLRAAGSAVIAGSYNLTAPVDVRVERVGADTRFAQITQLMQQAAVEKPPLARLADRFARPFLWGVLGAAALALLLWWPVAGGGRALMVAAAVLIVTCPCALSLATPAAMLAAAGSLARRGVLLRRLASLEALASVDTIVFDKTGTLTSDRMALRSMRARDGVAPADAFAQAAALARGSHHPVARAIAAAADRNATDPRDAQPLQVNGFEEVAGQGVQGCVARGGTDGQAPRRLLRLGSARFCGVTAPAPAPGLLQVHLADAAGWLASFEFAEELRDDAQATVRSLQQFGIEVELLSGDRDAAAQRIGQAVRIGRARGDCTPQDKLHHLKVLQAAGRRVAMVGDGLNDAPVLAAAHASFALGRALPLAQAQADFVVPGERLAVVAQTVSLARRTMRVVRQNLLWAALYNAAAVPLALAGLMPAWLAGLGMAASSLLVVVNAARLSGELPALEH